MHAASAQVGVAIAARLPNITLSGNGGTSVYHFAEAFTPGTLFYTVVGSVTQPVFDGFTLYNKQKAAESSLEQAEAARTEVIRTVDVAQRPSSDLLMLGYHLLFRHVRFHWPHWRMIR